MLDHLTDLYAEYASDRDIPADWPSAIVARAADLMKGNAERATKGPWHASPVHSATPTATSGVYSHAHPMGSTQSEVVASGRVKAGYGGIRQPFNAVHIAGMDPAVANLIADAWEDQADDMAGALAHFHAIPNPGAPLGWHVVDEREQPHYDWTATVRAALAFLREKVPERPYGPERDAAAAKRGDLLDLSKTQIPAVLAAEQAQESAA